MAPAVKLPKSLIKRASIKPLTPASLALVIVGSLLVISCAAVGFFYYRKRSARVPAAPTLKPDNRSSSTASEEHQMQPIQNTASAITVPTPAPDYQYNAGIMSRMSMGPRSPRAPRSPAPNRYSVGMLSRTSIDPSVSSPNLNRDRSRSRTREEKDRAYARMSMGIMSRSSMGARSPGPRSPMSPQDPLLSAGIMSRMSMAPVSPMPRNVSAAPSPAMRGGNDFLEPPPRYS